MKSVATYLSILLAITLASCARHEARQPLSAPAQALERTIAEQDRVNSYFYKKVVPKLMGCWSGLGGEGTVAVQAGYRRTGELWIAADSSIRSSTFTKAQQQAALRCFQDAVRDTSFPVTSGDGDSMEFQVNWSLPVPWPKDFAEVAQRMISTGGGGGSGCGGPESPGPACWDCFFIPLFSLSYCGKTCAGYSTCTPIANGCKMGPIKPKCITASPFGNQGGIVRY